jgi:hypothetical protein
VEVALDLERQKKNRSEFDHNLKKGPSSGAPKATNNQVPGAPAESSAARATSAAPEKKKRNKKKKDKKDANATTSDELAFALAAQKGAKGGKGKGGGKQSEKGTPKEAPLVAPVEAAVVKERETTLLHRGERQQLKARR